MNTSNISSDAADKWPAAPAGHVRLIGPPGPSRAVKVGRLTYVSTEGHKFFAPPADAKVLVAAGWIEAA
jgi:hypothetical protein